MDRRFDRKSQQGACLRQFCIAVLLIGIVCCVVASTARKISHCALLNKEIICITLIGTDFSQQRADVIYQIFLSPKTGRIAIIQIQRDSKVILNGRKRKLNSVLGINKQSFLKLVGEITGAKSDRYLILTFESAAKLVKALCPKGVMINNPTAVDFTFSKSEGAYQLVIPKGETRVTPKDFVMMARLRQSSNDMSVKDGDANSRLPRQQMLLKALMSQVVKNKDPRIIGRLRSVVKNDLDTDLSEVEMTALAVRFRSMNADKLKIEQTPGSPINRGMWSLDKTGVALMSGSLAAWAIGKPRIDIVIQTSDKESIGNIVVAVKEIAPNAFIRTQQSQTVPISYVSYAPNKDNKNAAKAIAKALKIKPPHRDQASYGININIGQDLIKVKVQHD